MSVPNQFLVTLDKDKVNMKAPIDGYTSFYHYNMFNAISRLNKAGLSVYIYLISQIPHLNNGIKNKDRIGERLFEFSPAAIATELGLTRNSVVNGWKELIKEGYITEISSNKFYFTECLPCDKPVTINNEY